MLAIVALHETVAVPDPTRLLGVIGVQLSPAGIVSLSRTVPPNPFAGVIVTVDVAEVPTCETIEVAESVKFWNLKIAMVEWCRDPLVPVIVRV